MAVRRIGRILGLALVLAGFFVVAFAAVNFIQASEAENYAESHIPGEGGGTITAVPTMAAAAPEATETPLPPPTDEPTETVTATPSLTTSPTKPPPTATPTLQRVVGSAGLPRGQGSSPVRIVIPRMKLDTGVEVATWAVVEQNGSQVSEWQIPYDAVGNLVTTARPGEAGNAVISGHHNLIGPNVFGVGQFAGLWNLQPSDPIYVSDALGRTFLYEVQRYYTLKELGEPLSVREEHAKQLLADDGTAILTLETCWNGTARPLSGNTYRWIVVARLIGTVDSSKIPLVK